MKSNRKYPAISIHPTLSDKLEVNWEQDYHNEFSCPECSSSQLRFYRQPSHLCQLSSRCSNCQKQTALACKVAHYIFQFQSETACPNPLCHQVGPNGITKGWIYLWNLKNERYKCHFCKIIFLLESKANSSWINQAIIDETQKFCFESDTCNLRNFYNNPHYSNPRMSCKKGEA